MKRDEAVEASIVAKFAVVAPELNERGRRLWAAAESRAIGYGGDAVVSAATGLSRVTIRKGRQEVEDGVETTGRVRRIGAGRPGIDRAQPGVRAALERLVDPLTRGDPTSPLRWTCKSRAKLAATLSNEGWSVSSTTVGRLLHELGYSLQSVRKTREGDSHPDRNAQFEHINATAASFLRSEAAGDLRRHQEEGIGRRFQERRARMAAAGHAREGAGARLSRRCGRQGDPVRRLRHGAQRGVGQRRSRPRHARSSPSLRSDNGGR